MSMQSTTSTNSHTDHAGGIAHVPAKWPLWKTYLFIVTFCSAAWAAILTAAFNLIG